MKTKKTKKTKVKSIFDMTASEIIKNTEYRNLFTDVVPDLFRSIFVICSDRVHDSGYKEMVIIGYDYNAITKEEKFYKFNKQSDVISFRFVGMYELSVDCTKKNVFHYFVKDSNVRFKIISNYSNVDIEIVKVE